MSSKNHSSVFRSNQNQDANIPKTPKPEIVSHALVMAAATIVVLAGIRAASMIVAPVLLALFATIILLVPLRWLRSIGCPSITSLIIVLGCAAVIFVGMARVVISSVTEIGQKIPRYTAQISEKTKQLENTLKDYGFSIQFLREKISLQNEEKIEDENVTDSQKTTSDDSSAKEKSESNELQKSTINQNPSEKETPLFLDKNSVIKKIVDSDGTELSKQGEKSFYSGENISETGLVDQSTGENDESTKEEKNAKIEQSEVLQKYVSQLKQNNEPSLIDLDPASVGYWLTKIMLEVRHLVETSFLVMIITIFMIFEASRFSEKVDRAFGKGPITNEHFHKIACEIRRYLFLKAVSSMTSAAAATIVYFCFGVPSPLFWGLVALFLYFIPNIGGIVAAIIPGLLIFSADGAFGVMAYAVCLIAIECTIGYGVEPRILGYGLGISTVVIFISLLTWGWILGPIGLFLAAPLTIMVKIILQAFKETEWIAILIGDHSQK
ncbi:MAG: AI-2E family transporter [Planctomycetaceae bacterium]|jgi:predicted PurR-regulated permease PerM|nr:AI-2E family transporter [Planctomycetaceae bacterium]